MLCLQAQGCTLTTPTIVFMREAFTPALLYVMLSRVTQRKHLRIVGHLTSSKFIPARAVQGLD